MDARGWKRMLLRGGLVTACLTSTWLVARAVPSQSKLLQLQTQREATVAVDRKSVV